MNHAPITRSAAKLSPTDWWWLVGLVGLSLLLRCYHLDASLWYDEVLTLVDYVRLPVKEQITTYRSLNNHILYTLLARGAIVSFGESAWALRLPAALLGVASVVALWWLARQLVSPWEARLTALMMAVSYHHVWFSQNARGYTGLLLFSLLATVFFLRCISSASRLWPVAYAVDFALAMYMHLSAVFLFVCHALLAGVLLAQHARQTGNERGEFSSPWRLIVGLAGGAALTFVLYAGLIPQMIDTFTDASTTPTRPSVAEWKSPLWTLLEAVRSLQYAGWTVWLGLPVAGGLTLVGLGDFYRRRPLVALLLILHVPLTMLGLWMLALRIWPRYFFVDLGFVLILLVHGAFIAAEVVSSRWSNDGGRKLSKPWPGVAVVAVLIGGSTLLLPRNYRFPKQDFRGARDFVEARRDPGDVVVATGLAATSFEKYFAPEWETVQTPEELEQCRRQGGGTWVVYSFPTHTKTAYPDLVAALEEEFTLVRTFPGTMGEGDVFVYRSRNR